MVAKLVAMDATYRRHGGRWEARVTTATCFGDETGQGETREQALEAALERIARDLALPYVVMTEPFVVAQPSTAPMGAPQEVDDDDVITAEIQTSRR